MTENTILVRNILDAESTERMEHVGPIIDFLQTHYPRGFNGNGRVWLNGSEVAVQDFDIDVSEDDSLLVVVAPRGLEVATIYLLAQIAIAIVSALISYLMAPKPPKTSAAARRVYDIANAQNQPALGETIPEHFGKCWFLPSVASQPYSVYENNIQYLNQILLIGAGEYEIRNILLGTTGLNTFAPGNINAQVFGPSELAAGFGAIFDATGIYEDVFTSVEVQNIDLAMNGAATFFGKAKAGGFFNGEDVVTDLFETGLEIFTKSDFTGDANSGKKFILTGVDNVSIATSPSPVADDRWYQITLTAYDNEGWRGWFEASRQGQNTFAIELDFVFPNGLVAFSSGGSAYNFRVELEVQIQAIVNGQPTGTVTTHYPNYVAATRTPQRYTLRYPVTPGRYRVRVRRRNWDDSNSSQISSCMWAALKAYIQHTDGEPVYGNVTLLALRSRATAQISDTSSNRISVQAVRKLPTVLSDFTTVAPTVNPVDAFAYVAMAGGATVAGLDMPDLKVLAGRWAQTNGFNWRFEDAGTVFSALQIIASSHRAIPSAYGYQLTMRLTRAVAFDAFVVSDEQYVEDSFKQTMVLARDDQVDGIRLSYSDPNAPGELTVLWPTTSVHPEASLYQGCTYQPAALNQAKFLWALRNTGQTVVEFETEYDAHNFAIGNRIAAATTFIDWIDTARVMAVAGLTLTLDVVPSNQGAVSVRVRSETGAASNVILGSVSGNVLTLNALPPFAIFTPLDGQEATSVVIGKSTQVYDSYTVSDISPSDNTIAVTATLYSPEPFIYPIPGEDGINPPPADPGIPNPDPPPGPGPNPTPVLPLTGGGILGSNLNTAGNSSSFWFSPNGAMGATTAYHVDSNTITGQRWCNGAPDQTYEIFATVVNERKGAFLSYSGPVGVWTPLTAQVTYDAEVSSDTTKPRSADRSLVFSIRRASDKAVVMISSSPYQVFAASVGGVPQ